MNRDRRKRLKAIIEAAGQLVEQLRTVAEEEQEALDNMPESLQLSDRWADMETASEALTEAADTMEDMITGLEEIL